MGGVGPSSLRIQDQDPESLYYMYDTIVRGPGGSGAGRPCADTPTNAQAVGQVQRIIDDPNTFKRQLPVYL